MLVIARPALWAEAIFRGIGSAWLWNIEQPRQFKLRAAVFLQLSIPDRAVLISGPGGRDDACLAQQSVSQAHLFLNLRQGRLGQPVGALRAFAQRVDHVVRAR